MTLLTRRSAIALAIAAELQAVFANRETRREARKLSSTLPGANWPLRRPSATMLAAARSFTEPPGLYHSALPKSVTLGRCEVT